MLSGSLRCCGSGSSGGAGRRVAAESARRGAVVVEIMVASANPGKRREFDEILALLGARQVRLVSPEGPRPEVPETGRTYLANARLKARAYALQYISPALGDDSGLAVDALGGAPGLYTARFGGPGLSAAERVELLLERLRGVPPERRGAHFVCALCLALPGGNSVTAHGYVYGRIAERPAGAHGFGYDPIFLLPRLGVTMAELPPATKHRLSHRGRAMCRLLAAMRARGLVATTDS